MLETVPTKPTNRKTMPTPNETISRKDLMAEIDKRFLHAIGKLPLLAKYDEALQLLEIRKNIPTDSDIIK